VAGRPVNAMAGPAAATRTRVARVRRVPAWAGDRSWQTTESSSPVGDRRRARRRARRQAATATWWTSGQHNLAESCRDSKCYSSRFNRTLGPGSPEHPSKVPAEWSHPPPRTPATEDPYRTGFGAAKAIPLPRRAARSPPALPPSTDLRIWRVVGDPAPSKPPRSSGDSELANRSPRCPSWTPRPIIGTGRASARRPPPRHVKGARVLMAAIHLVRPITSMALRAWLGGTQR